MNKAVMLSIQPKWCELIASGRKTIEVRKTAPKRDTPFKCYIYCTMDGAKYGDIKTYKRPRIPLFNNGYLLNGKVIGEFVCDRIEFLRYNCDGYGDEWHEWNDEYVDYKDMCLSEKELEDYLGANNGYAWHISDLKIYDTPKELSEFFRPCDGCDKLGTNRCTEEISPCRAKTLTSPPQSWCYIEGTNT